MTNFVRTNDFLKINNNDGSVSVVKFLKTNAKINKAYNNIILFSDQLDLTYMNRADTITFNVDFLLKHNIIPSVLYLSKNYITKHSERVVEYLNKFGREINEIYISNIITQYNFNYSNNIVYLEEIDFVGDKQLNNTIRHSTNEGLLGLLIALYLNYNRICYTFNVINNETELDLIKKFKIINNIEHTLSLHNCSNQSSKILIKSNLADIIQPITLIQQFFIHRDSIRMRELVQCLENNIENPYIDEIILLNEDIYNLEKCGVKKSLLEGKNKVKQINISSRLSFHYVINYIKHQLKNRICIIANTDIYFDSSLSLLRGVDLSKKFLALLRYNVNSNGSTTLHHGGRPDSQDVWIMDSNIQCDINDDFLFDFGKPGCDNAITYLMLKNRYIVINPSLSIKSYHLHRSNERDYDASQLVITPFYVFSKPSYIVPLKEISKTITDISKYIVYEGNDEVAFLRKNPFSYYNISELLTARNSNASDKLPLDDNNPFERVQKQYIAKLNNVFVGGQGLIYKGHQKYIINPIYNNIDIERNKKVKHYNKLATVIQKWGYGFYHFMCEQLPKIIYLKKYLSNDDIKLLTFYNDTFIKELLELCGIKSTEIVPFDNNFNYSVGQLYVSKPIYCGNPSREDIDLIRENLNINSVVGEHPIGIIIERETGSQRSMTNFKFISSMIKDKIPEKRWIIFKSSSIKQAIDLFGKADIIVAAHGAGLSNMIFAPKGIHIIEYIVEEEPNLCYWHLSQILNNKYYAIPVKYNGARKMFQAPFDKTIETLYKIIDNKLPTIHKPFRRKDKFDHTGDTFREMIDLWEENKLIKVIPSEEVHPWLNGVGNVLLYDRPTYSWFIPAQTQYKLGLFGNPNPLQDLNNNRPWIFWARRPRLMEKYTNYILNYEDRTITSAFIGKVENNTQLKHRKNVDWSKCIELFEMPINGNYKYSQEEYLKVMSQVKFGLCLRGFGGKCNREIELMGLGVVPIFTPGVNKSYYNTLKKNKHYLYAKNPTEVIKVIQSCSKTDWKRLSKNGREWYIKNCSTLGSFTTTIKIIKEHHSKALENFQIKTSINTLFGTTYGGFYLPQNIGDYFGKNENLVIYLFGVGEDITFDTYISGLLDCPVYLFDPTPRSILHVELVKKILDKKVVAQYNKRYGGGDKLYWKKILSYGAKSSNIKMNNYGIFTEDTELKFYKPENEEHVSHSLVEGMFSSDYITVPVKKITTIMNELGHTHIDIIKLDVEGVECGIIHQMFNNNIYPKFICIEFDIARNKKIDGKPIANKCLSRLTHSGYKLIRREGLDMSFIRQ